MKVVVPTNDFKNIERQTGHAHYFAVYDVEENEFTLVEKIHNDHHHHEHHHEHEHEHEHGHEHGHSEQAERINRYDAFIVNHLGPHFKKDAEKAGVNVFMTKKTDIKAAIEDYLANENK